MTASGASGAEIRQTSRGARDGMMLAAVLDGWEDRSAARWRLGKDGRVRQRGQAARAAQVKDWCGDVPTMRAARVGLYGGVMLHFEIDL